MPNLSRDQNVYRLGFYSFVLPQMVVKVRPCKERAEVESDLLIERHNARIKHAAEAPIKAVVGERNYCCEAVRT